MKIDKLLLILICLFFVMCSLTYSKPDLTIDSSDIIFSKDNPEPTQVITISATIYNEGSMYYNQHYSVPFSSHVYPEGISSHDPMVYGSMWYAQYFIVPEDLYLSKVSLRIWNYGITTDSVTVEIRNNVFIPEPKPGIGPENLLAYKTLVSTFTIDYGWQDFQFSTPPFLLKGSTYWICLENYAITFSTDGYLWYIDYGTPVDMVALNEDQGMSPWKGVTGNWSFYYKTYKCVDTLVEFYEGNPDTEGTLIDSFSTLTPIPSGENVVFSSTWSSSSEGSHDIYVAVDYPGPGIIDEQLEGNNTAYKTINVVAIIPEITGISPPPDSKGIDANSLVKVTFTKDMDKTAVEDAVTVYAIKDNEDNAISPSGGLISGTAVYAQKLLTFTPSTPFSKGHTYKVIVSTHAKDPFVSHLSDDKIWTFTTIMDYTKTNRFISDDGYTEVEIGQNAVPESDYYIEINTNPVDNTSINTKVIQANTKIKQNLFSTPLDGSICEFTLYRGTYVGTEFTGDFKAPVKITISYSDSDFQNDSSLVKENTLSIYWLNEEDNLWVRIPDSETDTNNNTVSVYVSHFSVYSIIGKSDTDLLNAYAYPVPWKPFDGNSETGTLEEGITFTDLGSEATIRIYSISGELVRVLEYSYSDGSEQKKWDVKNERGKDLASGLYIYYIENEVEHKSGKLIIVR